MLSVPYTRSATEGTNTQPAIGESVHTQPAGPTNPQKQDEHKNIEKLSVQCPAPTVTGGEGLPPIQQLKALVTRDLVGTQGQYLLKVTQPFSPASSEGELGPDLSELDGVKELLQGQRKGVKRNRPTQRLIIQGQPSQIKPKPSIQNQWLQQPPPPPPAYPPVTTSTSCERVVAEQRDIATRLAATLNHLQEKVTYLYSDHYGICSYLNEADRSAFCKGKQQIQEIVTHMQRAQSTAQEAFFVTSEAQFYKELHRLESLHRKSKLNHLYGTVRY